MSPLAFQRTKKMTTCLHPACISSVVLISVVLQPQERKNVALLQMKLLLNELQLFLTKYIDSKTTLFSNDNRPNAQTGC